MYVIQVYLKTILFCEEFWLLKLWYIAPCNFLTKRALKSLQTTLVFVKDSHISHYLNLSI